MENYIHLKFINNNIKSMAENYVKRNAINFCCDVQKIFPKIAKLYYKNVYKSSLTSYAEKSQSNSEKKQCNNYSTSLQILCINILKSPALYDELKNYKINEIANIDKHDGLGDTNFSIDIEGVIDNFKFKKFRKSYNIFIEMMNEKYKLVSNSISSFDLLNFQLNDANIEHANGKIISRARSKNQIRILLFIAIVILVLLIFLIKNDVSDMFLAMLLLTIANRASKYFNL